MRIVRTIAEMRSRPAGKTGFVPTMGAFHEGHLGLMRKARHENEQVVVSLFVNPTQFAAGEDFERYPRDLARDQALAEAQGVDILFAPDVDEMYGGGPTTTIQVGELTERWEGAARPGHFDGVATVVAKLFNIVRPEVAYFGQKDLQQCAVIQRMVQDLNIPVHVSIEPTMREPDGLAMSSRNVYLSSEDRQRAPLLQAELMKLVEFAAQPEVTASSIDEAIHESWETLRNAGFAIDYLEMVDPDTLLPIRGNKPPYAAIVAARLGRTRLIDNVVVR